MANDPFNLNEYEAIAKLKLPHNDWDTIDAGAMDMFTTRRNRTALEQLTLRPRFLRDISQRTISTTVLGTEIQHAGHAGAGRQPHARAPGRRACHGPRGRLVRHADDA